ncbi:hypothetical protein D3C81_1499480 [compost metagenome]
MADSTTMNAPVGPAICRRLPPNIDTASPATMAVYSPCSGLAPDAIANAIASGSATTPTITPDTRLGSQLARRNSPACHASRSAIMRRILAVVQCRREGRRCIE